MARVEIPYLVEKRQAGTRKSGGVPYVLYYWQPGKVLRQAGFAPLRLSNDLSVAIQQAQAKNAEVAKWRGGEGPGRPSPGSIPHLVQVYRASDAYRADISQKTREYNDFYIDGTLWEWSERAGHPPVGGMTEKGILTLYDKLRWPEGKRCAHGRSCPHDRVCPKTGGRCPLEQRTKAKAAIMVLSVLMRVAKSEGLITVNPCHDLKLKGSRPRQVVWPDEAIDAFCAKAVEMNRRSMALGAHLGADVGPRRGDAIGLTREQYQDGAFLIHPGKTEESSGVSIRVPTLPSLRAWLAETPGTSGEWVISEQTGRPYTGDNFTHVFAQIRSAAGLDAIARKHGITKTLQFRDLRRTAVVHLARAGSTIPEIAAVTGHSITQTQAILEVYLPRDSEMAASAIRKLGRYRKRTRRSSGDAVPESQPTPAPNRGNPARELAGQLARATRDDGNGGQRVWTRAEIEAEIQTRLGVPRGVAQSAASKACKRLDPDNPARRTHRAPVARAVDETLRDRFRALAAAGLSLAAIARETGADPKTVSRHLRPRAPPGSGARQGRPAPKGSARTVPLPATTRRS